MEEKPKGRRKSKPNPWTADQMARLTEGIDPEKLRDWDDPNLDPSFEPMRPLYSAKAWTETCLNALSESAKKSGETLTKEKVIVVANMLGLEPDLVELWWTTRNDSPQ